MVPRFGKVALVAAALCCCAQAGRAVEITLELVALGGYPDPHDITVPIGSTVELAYLVRGAENLAFFEDVFRITGPASALTLGAGAAWWESQANVLPNSLMYRPAADDYHLLGQTGLAAAPFSHSTEGPSSLALLQFLCSQAGDVVVTGLLEPAFAAADPATGAELPPLEIGEGSNVVVTIHQEQAGQIPEPMSLAVLAVGVAGLWRRARARRRG